MSEDVSDETSVSVLHQQTMPVIERPFAELSVKYNNDITASAAGVVVVGFNHHWLCPVHSTTN